MPGGSAFGLTAALMKGMTTHFSDGFGALFTSWQLYAMVATGVLGIFLVQSALNAGRLIAAQPGLTLSDPIVSILWGVLAFHEKVRGGSVSLMFAALSTVLLAAAVVALARSPLLADDQEQERTMAGSRPVIVAVGTSRASHRPPPAVNDAGGRREPRDQPGRPLVNGRPPPGSAGD